MINKYIDEKDKSKTKNNGLTFKFIKQLDIFNKRKIMHKNLSLNTFDFRPTTGKSSEKNFVIHKLEENKNLGSVVILGSSLNKKVDVSGQLFSENKHISNNYIGTTRNDDKIGSFVKRHKVNIERSRSDYFLSPTSINYN